MRGWPWQGCAQRNTAVPGEGAEFTAVDFLGFRTGVKIDFRQAIGETLESRGQNPGRHFSGVTQTEDMIGESDAVTLESGLSGAAQLTKDGRQQARRRRIFADEPRGAKAVLHRDRQGETQYRGMQMQMGMAIPVSRRQAERAKALELGKNLAPQRFRERGTESIAQPGSRGRRDESTGGIRDRRDGRSASIAEREMQADAQRGMTLRDAHRFLRVRLVNHEAGLGEKAGFMAALDGFVDFVAAAEVVASDDELFQFARGPGKLRCRDDDLPFLPSIAQAMSVPEPGWHGWLLVVPLTSVIYDVLVDGALARWMSESVAEGVIPPEPITFFRPLKRGVPRLREKLEMLVQSSLVEDQVLFGVDPGSEEETICEEVRRAFPERDVAVVRCEPGRAVNPKISKLVQMAPLARHASWLLSDSEMILSPEFLGTLRAEWQAEKVAALTTAYRFVNSQSWPQRCDALGVLLGLWPGISLVRRYGQVSFTLGACTLFQREVLQAIGGWSAFGNELAEDQRLGEALVRSGQPIRLSRQVATLDCDPLSWRDYWRHQRRVAVTYRAANPAGFAGVLLTFGPVWSLACLLAISTTPWILSAAIVAIVLRGWMVWRAARLLRFSVPALPVVLGIASVVEATCWLLSWFTRRVWWSGRWWRVGLRGTLAPVISDAARAESAS